jgi:superfamily II DNA/RNA helicase
MSEFYDLSRLSHIVFDEADTLLDDSFNSLSIRILQKLKVCFSKAHCYLSGKFELK